MQSLFEIMEHGAALFGARAACQMRETGRRRAISYKQLRDTSEILARSLSTYGLRKGDVVALLSENRPEWGIAFFALQRLGVIVVPLDKLLKMNELQIQLEQCDAKLIIASRSFIGLLSDMPTKIPLFSLDEEKEAMPTLPLEIEHGLHAPEIGNPEITQDSPAVMIFTSGTTGDPKVVMLSHGNLISNLESLFKIFPPYFFQSNFLSILPLHHAFELTCGFLAPLSGGGTITYQSSLKPSQILETMRETKTEIMLAVPAVLEALARLIDRQKSAVELSLAGFLPFFARRWLFREIHAAFGGRLRYLVSGGAPLSASVQEIFERLGITVIQGYGLTETAPVLTVNPFYRTRRNSVGRVIPGVEVKIAPDGEILARGPNLTAGYYKNRKATQEAIRDGYLSTGDLGYFDENGYLYISGRKKNLIVSSTGKKILPEEIEEKFKENPVIQEICVMGRKTEGKEEVTAVIRPDLERLAAEGIVEDKAQIWNRMWREVRKVNAVLADYKRVKKIFLWEKEFPKTTTMKIKRSDLQREVESASPNDHGS